jgi:hypothetical protein
MIVYFSLLTSGHAQNYYTLPNAFLEINILQSEVTYHSGVFCMVNLSEYDGWGLIPGNYFSPNI